jgi:hypothetical protein
MPGSPIDDAMFGHQSAQIVRMEQNPTLTSQVFPQPWYGPGSKGVSHISRGSGDRLLETGDVLFGRDRRTARTWLVGQACQTFGVESIDDPMDRRNGKPQQFGDLSTFFLLRRQTDDLSPSNHPGIVARSDQTLNLCPLLGCQMADVFGCIHRLFLLPSVGPICLSASIGLQL